MEDPEKILVLRSMDLRKRVTSALRVSSFSGHYEAKQELGGVCILLDSEVAESGDLPCTGMSSHLWYFRR